ncbi:Hydroxyacylglutathione hydrolase [Actinidia chinensis var. chinensis]|uniref:Hydroxyacylglutathione hydrolase n=1 Tax=Actinidia chinensis var. chinensis TaxID=1590841 RepID=A0A2R6QHN5_ACTCC|nr:Hydroxyacylglutathione hydrolase [Actinidia chinensis var. chinensis]
MPSLFASSSSETFVSMASYGLRFGNMMIGIYKKIQKHFNYCRRKDRVQFSWNEHVGYWRLDYHTLQISIVGGRPFSCGGEQLFQKKVLAARVKRSADEQTTDNQSFTNTFNTKYRKAQIAEAWVSVLETKPN